MILPPEAAPLLAALAPHLTRPTHVRLATLAAAAIPTTGRRTVADLLRTVGDLAAGHRTSYQRSLPSAQWAGLAPGCAPARSLLDRLAPDGPVHLAGDDTADGHPGRTAYGRGRHRDPVRSSHSYTAWRYGHRWVVLAVLMEFPSAARRWALPVPANLYRTPEVRKAEGTRHKTPAQLLCRLLRAMPLRFPDRRFVLVGDASYGTHGGARFCRRHHPRVTLVSKLCPDANLFLPPPPYRGVGRPRVKGERVPEPRRAAATAARTRLKVAWYGGGTRVVEAATGTGHWYKGGAGLVPVRWVSVRDATGTHRDEYPFATDPGLTAGAVAGTSRGRRSTGTTFQECRSCAGLETTRGRCRRAVAWAAPCLFGLYSVAAALYHSLPAAERTGGVAWPGKETVTFSDTLTAVCRWVRAEDVFPRAKIDAASAELPRKVRELLLAGLAPAP